SQDSRPFLYGKGLDAKHVSPHRADAMTTGTPPAEVDVDEELVAALVADQHPRYAGLPVRFFEHGWDNFTFRLGDDLCVRLPRRGVAVELLVNEQRCLPALAARLPLPVPAPVAVGRPGRGFPWTWSIVPWIEGTSADVAPPDGREAPVLAAFLRALHEPAPDDAPANPGRGVSLAVRAERMAAIFARLKSSSDVVTPGVERAWADALKADACDERVWLHGDLHARNVVTHDGKLAGVIDWGDMCGGDAATDLVAIWTVLDDREARAAALRDYAPSPSLAARAMGWAVLFGATIYEHLRHDDPRHTAAAAACLKRVAEDA